MANFHFDLISEPWIPVLTLKGQATSVGLRELLAQAHNLRAINMSAPVVRASLHRLLEAILQWTLPVETPGDWGALWADGNGCFDPAVLDAYFNRPTIRERFDLFDRERPFYQAADDRVKPKNLLKLVPHLSSGNNATLFDHSLEKRGLTLTPAEAALYLIGIQSFGLGGLSGIEEKFTAAPPSRGISFIVMGDNLFQTLMLNHIPYNYEPLHSIPLRVPSCDAPAWEMDDPYTPRDAPYGLCDYLTWLNRRVLLYPEEINGQVVVRQMTEAPGLRMKEDHIDGVGARDPYQYYRTSSQGKPTVLRFTEGRAVWRDSAALFRFEDDGHLKAPANMLWLELLTRREHRILQKSATLRVSALGFAADKAKVLFYGDESLPVPTDFLSNSQLVQHLELALQKAETLSHALYSASRALAETILLFDAGRPGSDGQPKRLKKEDIDPLHAHLSPDRVYWSGLEPGFHRLIEMLPHSSEKALDIWDQQLIHQVWTAIDHATTLAGEDVRARKGAVRARAIVGKALNTLIHSGEA